MNLNDIFHVFNLISIIILRSKLYDIYITNNIYQISFISLLYFSTIYFLMRYYLYQPHYYSTNIVIIPFLFENSYTWSL